jgi:hypothetical protein
MMGLEKSGRNCNYRKHMEENLKTSKDTRWLFLVFTGGSGMTLQQTEWLPFELLIWNDAMNVDTYN